MFLTIGIAPYSAESFFSANNDGAYTKHWNEVITTYEYLAGKDTMNELVLFIS